MAEEGQKYTKEAVEAVIEQDLKDTKAFMASLGKKIPEGLNDDLTILVRVYNEILEGLLRYTADAKTYFLLEELEPWNKKWTELKEESVRTMKGRRVTLKAIRQQLIQMLKAKK